jgi:hypothetical protein
MDRAQESTRVRYRRTARDPVSSDHSEFTGASPSGAHELPSLWNKRPLISRVFQPGSITRCGVCETTQGRASDERVAHRGRGRPNAPPNRGRLMASHCGSRICFCYGSKSAVGDERVRRFHISVSCVLQQGRVRLRANANWPRLLLPRLRAQVEDHRRRRDLGHAWGVVSGTVAWIRWCGPFSGILTVSSVTYSPRSCGPPSGGPFDVRPRAVGPRPPSLRLTEPRGSVQYHAWRTGPRTGRLSQAGTPGIATRGSSESGCRSSLTHPALCRLRSTCDQYVRNAVG